MQKTIVYTYTSIQYIKHNISEFYDQANAKDMHEFNSFAELKRFLERDNSPMILVKHIGSFDPKTSIGSLLTMVGYNMQTPIYDGQLVAVKSHLCLCYCYDSDSGYNYTELLNTKDIFKPEELPGVTRFLKINTNDCFLTADGNLRFFGIYDTIDIMSVLRHYVPM